MKTGLLLQTCTAVEMARKMPGFARKTFCQLPLAQAHT